MGLAPIPIPQRRWIVQLGPKWTVEASPGSSTLTSGYVDCDFLEPTSLSHTSLGEPGELRVYSSLHPEDMIGRVQIGQAVRLFDSVNNKFIFDGTIIKQHVVVGGESDRWEAVVWNNGDLALYRDCLHGQVRRNHTLEAAYFDLGARGTPAVIDETKYIVIDTPTVFNEGGIPNRTEELFYVRENSAHTGLFEAPGRRQASNTGPLIVAVPWTLRYAVAYVLSFSAASSGIDPTSFNETAMKIFDTYGDPVVSNVNIEGKSLAEALCMLLEPHNYGFSVDPQASVGQKHAIRFWFRGSGTVKSVKLAPRGTAASLGQSNLIYADWVEDASCVANCLASYGDQTEQTQVANNYDPAQGKTLVKGWQDSDLDFASYLNSDQTVNWTHPEFTRLYRDPSLVTPLAGGKTAWAVGRVWIVNLGEVPNRAIEDLISDFGFANGVDQRRFEPPEFFDKNSLGSGMKRQDIAVEMSFDGGVNFVPIESSNYRVLDDGMGIVFDNVSETEKLGLKAMNAKVISGINYWDALRANKLKIRVLASVKSDHRVTATRSNSGTSFPLAIKRVFNNTGYRQVEYTDAALATVTYVNTVPVTNAFDDTGALLTITNQVADLTDRRMFSGTMAITLTDPIGTYQPGNILGGIVGRSFSFSPSPTFLRVVYDLTNLHVQFALDNRKVQTVLNARPYDDRTPEERRLGVYNPEPLGKGKGHQVPYKNDATFKTYLMEGGQ